MKVSLPLVLISTLQICASLVIGKCVPKKKRSVLTCNFEHNTNTSSLSSVRSKTAPSGSFLGHRSASLARKRDSTNDKCSPPASPHGSLKRGIQQVYERNYTLSRRVMTLPGTNMDTFMEEEATTAVPFVFDNGAGDDYEDMATSLFAELYQTGADNVRQPVAAFSYGTQGLCGCTVLIIISRKGVYAAHYWENISFAPDDEWLEEFKTPELVFQNTVIKGLTDGRPGEQVSLKANADKISDPSIRAYLIRPSKTYDGIPDGYRDKWDMIKSTVGSFIPALAPDAADNRWEEVTYARLRSNSDALFRGSRGKVLFK